MSRIVKIGLLGCGTVGSGFVSLVESGRDRIRERHGLDIEIDRILIRDRAKRRAGVNPELLTTRAEDVVGNGIDVLVEVIGGIEPAGNLIRRAIERGKPVVTANKLLLAVSGAELFAKAKESGVAFGFEASVCGGVPVVKALKAGLTGDAVTRIRGVLNGTCNFILNAMEEGRTYEDALAEAQAVGFAEADPALDVDGHDSLQKLQILAGLAFGEAKETYVRVQGIRDYPFGRIRRTGRKGRTTRLVAEARFANGVLNLCVEPCALEPEDPLGRLKGAQNGVVLSTEGRGDVLLTGLGAGALPTASAVLTDVIEVAGG